MNLFCGSSVTTKLFSIIILDIFDLYFKDVCFKALEPDNTNCTIMTVWNYWQNEVAKMNEIEYYYDDIKKINYTIDYRDHFQYCTQ